MNWQPVLLGVTLGAGLWIAFSGLRRMFNNKLSENERKKGFWPMNAGFALACLSMYLMGRFSETGGG
ncbi:MAG: hypothetical protein CMM44_03540 [Rhodospirillaceae bacterium]|nr:hypothetical protein [Rhodospirillaceae bacterium]|tara:strand:- start:17413 stop:17613 length:201 start_codon:yes stop_codon:yes gene_type:complete